MQNKSFIFFVFIFLLSLTTFAQANILTQYRLYGINGIQRQMDSELTHREYWDDYLSDIDTTFGYIESYTNVLVCDKSKSQLSLYVKDADHDYNLLKDYSAYTGKNRGDKVEEGDLRTPIGVYTLTQKLSKLDSFYGPMAFVTSYPNIYDKYNGKDGHGIWIHGLPLHQQRDAFTKGCIAINNSSIECLDRNIDIDKTILIINEKGSGKEVSKDAISDILSQLYAWRYAWLYNDINAYLNFYDNSFIRFDGMDIKRFTSYKQRIFRKKEKKTILFHNLNVIPYPGTKDMYKITFHEIYKSDSFSFTGDKVLIVKLENSKMKIITEQ